MAPEQSGALFMPAGVRGRQAASRPGLGLSFNQSRIWIGFPKSPGLPISRKIDGFFKT